ncbi:MAG: lipoyl(octanoyl) transferase LipB [Bacteroidales bacterium]
MLKKVNFQDLRSVEYKKAWEYQEKLFDQILEAKSGETIDEKGSLAGYLLFCEHPHVYTLGKSGTENNLLIDDGFLKKIKAQFYRINRGGDITYHGPGQIVGYPILNLEAFSLSIRQYIYNLEQAIIQTLLEYGLEAERLPSASGVWLDADKPLRARKICAIGVRASRYVTMHGFAFNVSTDLEYFNYINPCGLKDKGVTTLEKELGKRPDMNEVKEKLKAHLASVFQMELNEIKENS